MVGSAQATPVGVIAADALPGISRHWVLVDASEADGIGIEAQIPSRILLSLDPAAPAELAAIERLVVAAQPEPFRGSVRTLDAASRLAEVQASPTVAGLRLALLVTAAAALMLTLIAVVLASVAAAGARNRMVGVLRVLGMNARQVRSLVGWELTPVAVLAVLVGTGLGLSVPYLVTAILDLRVFVGGRIQPAPVIDPVWITAAVGAFILVVALAAFIAGAIANRFVPAGALKMGDE
jgi:putative ABC transport system permease protein